MKTLIRNATIVSPEAQRVGSVLIEGATIASTDPSPDCQHDTLIDANGLHLLPGVIDDQVHFREPGLTHKEDFAHATRACAAGGVTTFLEMPNTIPTTTTCQRLDDKLALAAESCLVNFGFYIGATPENLAELQRAERTPGIKIFIGSSTGDLLVDAQDDLERIFAGTTLPICAHCEDEATIRRNRDRLSAITSVSDHSRIRDHEAAVVATRRAIDLAHRHHHRFHVLHVSTADELELLRASQSEHLVTAEACPHHLLFNIDDYPRLGTRIQMNPSIKTAADNQALWQALLDGTIQVVATDHAPHTLAEKEKPYPDSPSGLPAVENSLALLLNQVHLGRCRLEDVVLWMSEAPARVWDMVGKGKIEVGYDADLVLVDLKRQQTIRDDQQRTKSGWSPWHGETLTGWPVRTWVRGQQVFGDGRIDETCRGQEVQFDHSQSGYWK